MLGARKQKPKPIARASSFHYHYIDLCQAAKTHCAEVVHPPKFIKTVLDFSGDRLGFLDWQLVNEALRSDLVLEVIDVHLRRRVVAVDEAVNSEAKAKNCRHRPVLTTKYVFTNFTAALANCVGNSHNLRVLHLEGLPLSHEYLQVLVKAVASNDHLADISLERSHIGDKGCEDICNSVAYLMNVSKLNLSGCDITHKGVQHIVEMFKIQKVSRFSLGWHKSLNYCDRREEHMPGLHWLSLARNPQIGDDGLRTLLGMLKQDVWIKVINMENCGLTDQAACLIVDCLKANEYIREFNVAANNNISWATLHKIGEQLNQDPLMRERLLSDDLSVGGPWVVGQLRDQIQSLDEAVAREASERKRIDQLNFEMNEKLLMVEEQLRRQSELGQEGYVVVEEAWLRKLLHEQPDFPRNELGLGAPLTDGLMVEPDCAPLSLEVSPRREERPRELPAAMAKPQGTVALSLRQVRSAAKYEEPPPKGRKESKSSHAMTHGNEKGAIPKAIQFERLQIGDSIGGAQPSQSQHSQATTPPNHSGPRAKTKRASNGYHLPATHAELTDWDVSPEEYGFQSTPEMPSAMEPLPDWESKSTERIMTPRSLFLGPDWRRYSS